MMPLSLSYDHRLVDGAAAARFLNDVIDCLQSPGQACSWPDAKENGVPMDTNLCVLGGGPGGYAAAFLAADSGHASHAGRSGAAAGRRLPACGAASPRRPCCTWPRPWPRPGIWPTGACVSPRPRSTSPPCGPARKKSSPRSAGGLKQMAKKRNVRVVQARATFEDSQTLRLAAGRRQAAGRRPRSASSIASWPPARGPRGCRAFDLPTPRVMDSHRRAGAARRARVAAGRRRRLHRPGDGHRLCRPGQPRHRWSN